METNQISIGIFFDGTGNNGLNATSTYKPSKNNGSYYSSTTNIYKLFGLFTGDRKIYIEGIGTLTGKEDSDFAMATCKNPARYTGYSSDDKLEKAFAFVNEKIKDKAEEYHFYVYGFSRGAMLARTFCYELLKTGSKITGNIKVKFLGVFDTVESTPFNDYNVSILPGVENALHLCAVNECRYFFPLTGFFEDSDNMKDTKTGTETSVWKEIFIPGAHADVGGGYLEGPQSVYVSADYRKTTDVEAYVDHVRNTKKDADGNYIWNELLTDYRIDEGIFFSQAYVARDLVYNDLSKVYGKLVALETNTIEQVFSTHFTSSDFEIDPKKHPFLIVFSEKLEKYVKDLSPELKPGYKYDDFVEYTHISANFGLHKAVLLQRSESEIDVEMINNSLNVPGNPTIHEPDIFPSQFQKGIPYLQESSVIDYAYGTNIPNNDIWYRSILIK
ncbi:T6SS phospholipase effector Tle1-like catalytic domain-containing protein [Chryseobacterium defluvii]|uniref:Putative alpha/beta hydrolase family protein DUF2235 n=1 Tax=Chryseobacterium defluvii TaxID=160396 RepID=A0A495SP13_9FLAO|nr:DUF2235 domain-containing protein [Chryseobacterium defluvii]RKT01252.1 putative alpha/beta hydrolase family protein DUF2235 [Chryseobacterium defluvii]